MVPWSDPRAACLGEPLSTFFPENSGSRRDRALGLCRSCPVRAECLAAALEEEHGQPKFGIRGGLTAKQRSQKAKSPRRRPLARPA